MTAILNGIDEETNGADVPTTTDSGITLPVDVDIPESPDELIGLLDDRTAKFAEFTAEEWAKEFRLSPGEAENFFPIDREKGGRLDEALEDIREDYIFETGQAQDVFTLRGAAAKQKFGVGARGLRMGLLGVAQSITGQAASAGFAKSGQTQRQQETASRAGGQGLSDLFGQKSLKLQGADITRQGAIFDAGNRAQGQLKDLLETVAQRIARMVDQAAAIREQGGGITSLEVPSDYAAYVASGGRSIEQGGRGGPPR